jgi:hypothetical protein
MLPSTRKLVTTLFTAAGICFVVDVALLACLFAGCGEAVAPRISHVVHSGDAGVQADADPSPDGALPPDAQAGDAGAMPDAGSSPGDADQFGLPPDLPPPASRLYRACAGDADCDQGQLCEGIGTAAGQGARFCVIAGCDASGDGEDPRCVVPYARGKCYDFGSQGDYCLVTCAQDADCPPAQACNAQVGACFSTCQTDADCGDGLVCDPNAPSDRRLCVRA